MVDSLTLYYEACRFAAQIPQNFLRNYYFQIVTTMFYELTTKKNSPILSKFCADNSVTIDAENFKIEKVQPSPLKINFCDIYFISHGLDIAFEKNLDACAKCFNENIFHGKILSEEYTSKFFLHWQNIDSHLEKFYHNEEKLSWQNRKADDEKIIDEIKKVQLSMQETLKKISAIQDETEFRGVKEPINQLIQLYRKLDENLKRHPMTDTQKGYAELIKRCNKMLNYIVQSLKMLGVEVIDETGGTFNPDRNKVADDSVEPLDSVVTKIVKVGFSYKGVDVIEKAEVEVAEEKIL